MALAQILGITALLGSGLVAGVLFAVALSVMPALIAMPADHYVEAHQLLGRHYDPIMPILVGTSTMADVALAVLAQTAWMRMLFAGSALLLLGVMVISQTRLVPINRRVGELDPNVIPHGWDDPRLRWRNWHLVRTTFALLALVMNAAAIVSM